MERLIRNTILKLTLCIIFMVTAMVMILLFSAMYIDDAHLALLAGMILSAALLFLMMGFVFPIIFKDYIEYFWKKEQEKEELKLAEEASSKEIT